MIGRSMPAVLGRGAALATIVGVFEYTGGLVVPTGKDPQVDDFDRKEALKKRYRRPVEETINEIGEGRGMTCLAANIVKADCGS